MNRMIFQSYQKQFPALEYIIRASGLKKNKAAGKPTTPQNLDFIRIDNVGSLPKKIDDYDNRYKYKEIWTVHNGEITRIDNRWNGDRNVDYFVHLHYLYINYTRQTFSANLTGMGLSINFPGDTHIHNDFWISIYELSKHRQKRRDSDVLGYSYNKFLNWIMYILRRAL